MRRLLLIGGASALIALPAGALAQTDEPVPETDPAAEEVVGKTTDKALHSEGHSDSGWVLLDYGDVIVHIFSAAQRAFYNLEQLWAPATPVVNTRSRTISGVVYGPLPISRPASLTNPIGVTCSQALSDEHFGCDGRLSVGDSQIAGALVGQCQKATDPPRDGVLRQRWVRERTELFE